MMNTQHPNVRYSALELEWQKCQSCCSFLARSVPRYDAGSMMFYFATEHVPQPRQGTDVAAPAPSVVCDSMVAQVKGEFDSVVEYGSLPPAVASSREDVHSVLAHNYLFECERFVRDGTLDSILRADSITDQAARRGSQCYEIICHTELGNPKNARFVDRSAFVAAVDGQYRRRLPLQFVVPSFPFKDQNPFRTASRADHVDFGEVALLIRLHSLALALAQVYPYGVEWVIVSDGLVYSDFLGINQEEAVRYRERLREWRNRLNLQKTVHILDFGEVIERMGEFTLNQDGQPSSPAKFDQLFGHFRDVVSRELAQDTNQSLREKFAVLVRGMTWNINLHDLQKIYGREILWAALTGSPAPEDLTAELSRRGTEAALDYGCFNLAAKSLRLLESVFPEGIRATVHPKNGQVAIPRLGGSYPWNGVAFVKDEPIGPGSVETRPWYEVAREPGISACYFVADDAPFYFRSTGGGHA